jgi:cold shock CspA family protein
MKGTITHWSPKGFGFLFSEEIRRKAFFHASSWNRVTDPEINEGVTFELAPSRIPGKPDQAVNVTPIKADVDAGVVALTPKAGAR